MATIGTRLYTFLNGRRVGQDVYGNAYFESKRASSHGKRKRWVLFKGRKEPSKVPAEWHRWLVYTADKTPAEQPVKHYSWEQEHLPNLSGTQLAYYPPGHVLRGAKRERATGDYQPWAP